MRPKRSLYTGRILVLVLVAALLAGCQTGSPRSDRASADWARGVAVGTSALNAPCGLDVGPTGDYVYLAWVSQNDETRGQVLTLGRIDSTGREKTTTELALSVTRPSAVQAYADATGRLHLFWLDTESDRTALYHAIVQSDGMVAEGPQMLSPEGDVSSYAMDMDGAGNLHLVWAATETSGPGLFHTVLPVEGEARTRELGLEGSAPAIRIDTQGTIHLAWQQEPDFGVTQVQYAEITDTKDTPPNVKLLESAPRPTGLLLRGPSVGLDTEGAYVFWSVERRGGGQTPPKADSYYVYVPVGHPEQATEPAQVLVPPTNRPAYEEADGSLIQQLAPSADSTDPANFVYFAAPSRGQMDELSVAFSVQIEGRTKALTQTVLTLWSQGSMLGYQIVGQTTAISLRPSLVLDPENALHVTWVDTAGFGTYQVYYATTRPSAQAYLNRTTGYDVLAALFDILWGAAQAFGFVPMVAFWLLPGLALLGLYAVWSAEDGLEFVGPRIVLAFACLAYLTFKYTFRSSWLTTLRLPPGLLNASLADTLILVAPLLIIGLAMALTYIYARRREGASMFAAYFIFAGADALLTLLIYVPSALAE